MNSNSTYEDGIRNLLLSRRAELSVRLSRIEADMRREHEPLSADFAEQVTQRENDEVLESIGDSSQGELFQIDQALVRLADGRYGVCEACGEPIERARLDSVPHASRCSECART